MKALCAFLAVVAPCALARAQSALSEPPEFPAVRPGPTTLHYGDHCFHLASGTITPGDVDWVRVSIPRATTQLIVDVDFPTGAGASALLAIRTGASSVFNVSDNNGSRDNFCGLGANTIPVGSAQDSAVSVPPTPRNSILDVGVTGAQDTSFNGNHAQSFAYDVWLYVIPVNCASDADCDDAVACTLDSCAVGSGVCTNAPDDGLCDDGLFCTGVETCVPGLGCANDLQDPCDDGIDCTWDDCDEVDLCTNDPVDEFCDDGTFCNGSEVCDPAMGCVEGSPPDCDDGIGCTFDECDLDADDCLNSPDDAECDNGLFCDGPESCNAVAGCISGDDPCVDQLCRESDQRCVDCLSDADCDDGDFCNGDETCDADGNCSEGEPPCGPGMICDPDGQMCLASGLTLDIQPWACPNKVSRIGHGFVPAALTGSEYYNVGEIDTSSLELSRVDGVGHGVRPLRGPPGPGMTREDITAPYDGEPCDCARPGPDGHTDLIIRFNAEMVARRLELARLRPGTVVELRLNGRLRDGTPFELSDCVTIARDGGPSARR
jgi:hypothetical protein